MHPFAEAVKLAEAHHERAPAVGVDAIGVAGQLNILVDMDADDFDFESDEPAAHRIVVLGERMAAFEHGFKLHRAFDDPRRRNQIGRQFRQSGRFEFFFS